MNSQIFKLKRINNQTFLNVFHSDFNNRMDQFNLTNNQINFKIDLRERIILYNKNHI
jgi:hypothetical protein